MPCKMLCWFPDCLIECSTLARLVGPQTLQFPKQLAASLKLTRWLMARFQIAQRNVIGHAESLSSPYHHELVASLRTQTHGDWNAHEMLRYRALLKQP